MKLWKQWAALVIAVLMVCMAVACTPAEQTDPSENQTVPNTQATTEATTPATSEATEASDATEPTIDLTPYKGYLGTWYADGSSAGYRFILSEDLTWEYALANEESVFGGNFIMGESCLNMYDPDGSLAVTLTLEEEGKLYAEIYTDSLMDMLSTAYFFNTVTSTSSDYIPVVDDTLDTIPEPTENTGADDTMPVTDNEVPDPQVGSDEITG